MRSPGPVEQCRLLFKWTFLLSLPLLVALHAPMLSSEALPHWAYHKVESALGSGFPILVHVGMAMPAVALVGLAVTTAIARRNDTRQDS